MTDATRLLFPLRIVVTAIPLLAAGIAWADTNERCTSMLCNLYDRVVPASPSKPGSLGVSSNDGPVRKAKPDVNGTPASNSSYWTDTQGGLLGGLAGTPENCTSKTCNLYYGDNPPEDAAVDAGPPLPTVGESMPVESYDAPHAAGRPRNVMADSERSACEPSSQDPWRCYRR